MKRFFNTLVIALSSCIVIAHAEGFSSLILTDAEMQKLKHFFPAEENAHLIWQGVPLEIQLPIAKEKRLIFPMSVSVDVKGALNTNQLRIINNNKSVYLTALKAFPKTRIFVTLQNGSVMILDIMTNAEGSSATLSIEIMPEAPVTTENDTSDELSTSKAPETVTYVDLVRFAYQQLYAPERLLKHHYARVPMQTEFFTANLIYGDKAIVHPLASWRAGDYYVTAIALQNKYARPTYIDVRNGLCGNWSAATIYPRPALAPYGDKLHDSATLFLVSQKSFSETIRICYGDA